MQLTYYRESWQILPGQLERGRNARIVDLRQYDHQAQARAIITAQQPETPLTYNRWRALRPPTGRPWHGFEREAIDRATHDAAATERQEQPVGALVYWSRTYAIPIWLPLLIFAAPGGLWLRGVLRRRRGAHECPNCGYDLRATPDRCPECGMAAG